MKKSVLLFASLLLAAVSAIAQPAKPTVTYSDWASVEEKADIYLYNVEAGMFLSAGSAWGTRASLVGTKDKSTYNDLIMGAGEFKGNKWFIAAAQDQRDGKACYMFENKSGKNYLTADNKDGIWVDGDTGRPYDGWYIAKDNGDKTFQLGYMLRTEKKDEAGNVIKEGDKTVYEYSSMGIFGVQKFDEGNLDTYLDESTAYSTWAIVSASEYEEKLPAFKLYYIAKGLEKLVADAKELGIEADFSSYEALLVKEGVTYDEIKTAIDKFSPTVNFGKVIADAKKADPARDWSKYEAIYVDPESTNAIFTTNTNLIKAFLALKKAVDDAKALDAAKTFAQAEALYADDEAAQADIEAETKRVNAYSSLKKALDEAAQKGCTVTDYTAVYNNAESTAEALAQAEEAVKNIITAHDIADTVKDASADNPADLTSYIVNSTFDTIGDFTGWSTGFGAGGDKSTCAEVWRNSFDVYQDIKGLPEGVYMVACNGYSRHNDNHIDDYAQWKSGAVSETKIYMKSETLGQYFTPVMFVSQGGSVDNKIGNGGQTDYAYEEGGVKHTLYCPNSMVAAVDYFHDGTNRYRNEAYGPLAAGETLRIGVSNTNKMYWSIFDDFQLFYFGNGADAYKKWAESVKSKYNISFEGETYYGKPEKQNYETILATLSDASNKDAVSAAILNVDAAVEKVTTSKTNYAAYVAALATAQKWLEENVGDDDNFYKLSDYMEAENAEDVATWEFPNGPVKVIIPDYGVGGFEGILSAEDIATETTYLQNLLTEATRTTLADGSDLTNLIKNPAFDSNTLEGWTNKDSKAAINSKCVEAYGKADFDVYQEVADLPEGLYEISVQGFYRYVRPETTPLGAYEIYQNQEVSYVKPGGSPAFVYMNQMATPFVNIYTEPKEAGFYGGGYQETTDGKFFPNDMGSAATAFDAGMYTQKAYGLVKEGEVMRIGVKGSTNAPNDNSWVIFDNFKLTYRAKNPEVVTTVLNSKSQELAEFIENNSDAMTDPILQLAQDAYKESIKTDLNNTAKYDVLIETNEALVAAQENIKLIDAYKAAEQAYDDACTALETVDPNAAIFAEVKEMDEEIAGDAYMDLNNEELDDLTVRVKALTDKVNAAKADAEMKKVKEEMASASDDDPYDATGFIVNPDLSIGKADGWTVMALGQNNGYQDNNTYTNGDVSLNQFIECWRSGAILDDGTIEQTTAATLPAGTYTLGADINAKWQPDANVAIEGLVLFVSDAEGKTNSTLLDTQDASPKHFDVTFKLDKESVITLGVMAKSTNANWLAADNFKLTYYGTASAKEESGDAGDANAIEGVEEAAPAAKAIVAIYNAAGAQISTLQPGINIVKYADGTTKKIFKK